MKMDTQTLINGDVLENRIEEAWAFSLSDKNRPWVTSSLPCPTLDEWLLFSIDPSHSADMRRLLMPNALSLFSQLAYCVDMNVEKLGSTTGDRSTRRKRTLTSISLQEKRAIAERVWLGQDRFMFVQVGKNKTPVLQDRFLTAAAKNVCGDVPFDSNKLTYSAQFVYYYKARSVLSRCKVYHIFMDGSSIGGSPSELVFVWAPEVGGGAYAPVFVTQNSSESFFFAPPAMQVFKKEIRFS